jgi:peptidoglycan/LPS O-acetylase OafA/YrhL
MATPLRPDFLSRLRGEAPHTADAPRLGTIPGALVAGRLPSPPPGEPQPASVPVVLSQSYRADIDGLRALAVLGVVLFHARVPGFSGGYVGVDVFFVISGYLITRLLDGSAAGTTWSWLSTFYMRRARRILPALLVTSAVAAVAASLLLLPWDLVEFGKFLAASSVFLSNLAAWQTNDYFNLAGYGPLMHFWSLAVEEQFYLAYPLVLLFLTRALPRHRLTAAVALALASFALCVWGSYYKPRSNFFMAPTRAWELLLGAIVALGELHWSPSRTTRELLSVLAVVALALVMTFYDAQVPYPGLATLVPCGATAILIATNGERVTVVGKVLRQPPLVFTGLLSYSLYLWHLPILVLANYYDPRRPGAIGLAVSFAVIYATAIVSWRLFEKPIRARAFLTSDRTFLWTAGTINVALLALGLTLWISHGLPQRFDEADVPRNWVREVRGCDDLALGTIASGGLCSFGPQTQAAPTALVWGDSHAIALLPAYRQLASSYGTRVYFAVKRGCLPLLGVTNGNLFDHARRSCDEFNGAVVKAIERLNPRLVILNGQWSDKDEDLVPDRNLVPPSGTSTFRFALERTVKQIGVQHSICAVLDVPTFKYDVPRALVMARLHGRSSDSLLLSRAEALRQFAASERDIRMLQQEHLLMAVDPKDVLCRSGWCAFRSNGNVLYGDSNHLSTDGALLVAGALDGCFHGAPKAGLQAGMRE